MSYEEEKQDRKIEQLEAEIERLRAELAKVNRAREAEIDQAGAAERMYLEGVRAKDVRIKELEDALVEERGRGNHYGMEYEDAVGDGKFERWIIDGEKDSPKFYLDRVRSEARRQLQAEGKIGSGDHIPDITKKVWQITDERILAIENAISSCVLIERYTGLDLQHETTALRAMLEEAGQ